MDALPHAFWTDCISQLRQAGRCVQADGHVLYRRTTPDTLLDAAHLSWGGHVPETRPECVLPLPPDLSMAVVLRPDRSLYLAPLQLDGGALLDMERAELLLSRTTVSHMERASPDGRWVELKGDRRYRAYDLQRRTSCSLPGDSWTSCGRFVCQVHSQIRRRRHRLTLQVRVAANDAVLASGCLFEGPAVGGHPAGDMPELAWSSFTFSPSPKGCKHTLLYGIVGAALLVCDLHCNIRFRLQVSGRSTRLGLPVPSWDVHSALHSPSGQQLFIFKDGLLLQAISTTSWQAEAPELPLHRSAQADERIVFGPTCAVWLQQCHQRRCSLQLMNTVTGASRALREVQLDPQRECFGTVHAVCRHLAVSPCGRWLVLAWLESAVPKLS